MLEKYKIYLVWKSSSTRYATFAIVGACEKISLEFFIGAWQLRACCSCWQLK